MTNKQLVFEFKVKVGFGNSLHVGFEAVKYIFVSENMLNEKRAWASILGGLVRTDEIEEELLEGRSKPSRIWFQGGCCIFARKGSLNIFFNLLLLQIRKLRPRERK